jgi:hypothetical protein
MVLIDLNLPYPNQAGYKIDCKKIIFDTVQNINTVNYYNSLALTISFFYVNKILVVIFI